MFQKCQVCQVMQIRSLCKTLPCQKHFVCSYCSPKNSQQQQCDQCQIVLSQYSIESDRNIRSYPIQGIMINHDPLYNPKGESQFSWERNCFQRTNGWILCNFLAIVFFFSGLAMAINTSEVGSGVIMGIVASVYFIWRIRKVDKQSESAEHLHKQNFIYLKKQKKQRSQQHERRTILSVHTSQRG